MTWRTARLEDVAEVRLGRQRAPKNHHGDSMRPYLRAANVTWDGLNLTDVNTMNFTDKEMDTYRLEPGDILLSEASGSASEVGKPALWTGEIDACAFQNTLIRVRPREHEPRFLLHFFRWQARAGRFVEHSRGVGIHHLGRARLAAWLTPIPPIEEQQRIVDILEDHLSRLDAASGYVRAVERRLAVYRQSRLDEITESQSIGLVPLSELVLRIEAGRSFGGSAAPARDGEWGIVKVSAMTLGEFRPEENKRVADIERIDDRHQIHAGDLLVSRANTTEYVGASVIVRDEPDRLLLSDKSLRLVPRDGVSTEFLHRLLAAPRARRQISERATGTKDSMRNISQTALLSISVPQVPRARWPAVVDAAQELDLHCARIASDTAANATRSILLRRALLQAAFSGQLTPHRSDEAGGRVVPT